jgi:hypothetical protein
MIFFNQKACLETRLVPPNIKIMPFYDIIRSIIMFFILVRCTSLAVVQFIIDEFFFSLLL